MKQLWSTSNCLYLARNLSLRLTINTLGNSKPNWSWQYLTVSITFVLKSFIKNLLMTKSSDRISETLSGHTSRPYNNTGKHLLLIRCRVTSSTYFAIPKIFHGLLFRIPIDRMNVPTRFEVRSFTRSRDNRGYPKNWTVPGYAHALFSPKFLTGFYS